MFDVYFCPRVVARLQSHADTRILKEFLGYLHDRGYARLTIQGYVRAAELFLPWLRRRRQPLATIDETIMRGFARRHQTQDHPCANTHASLRHLLRYLRNTGLVPPRSLASRPAVERIISDYGNSLEGVCGLATATRQYRKRYAREFLHFAFGADRIQWKRIQPSHVQGFIAQYGQDGRVGAAQVASASLRSFLRWLQFQGRTGPNLAGAVPRFPRWRFATLPGVMTDEQLTMFLATFPDSPIVRTSSCSGRRGRNARVGPRGDAAGLRVGSWLRGLDRHARPATHGSHAITSCWRGSETRGGHSRSSQPRYDRHLCQGRL